MSSIPWTDRQLDAIQARGGTILVSAAAGSGKTAVLVERVVRLLTDPMEPIDADRLLIVTFSNAAAGEMRQRISERLELLLQEEPGNPRLLRQQMLVESAQISTVHAFCANVLRSYFYRLEIPANFRIVLDDERKVFEERAIRTLLEEEYTAADPVFFDLVELVSASRNDRNLEKTILRLYQFLRNHPFYQEWIEKAMSSYDVRKDVQQTVWGKIILDYLRQMLNYCRSMNERALTLTRADEVMRKAYEPALASDAAVLDAAENILNASSWDEICAFFQSVRFAALGPLRKYDDLSRKDFVRKLRDEMKEAFADARTSCLTISQAAFEEDMQLLSPIISKLFELVLRFDERFSALKRERGAVDFSDLEHEMLHLLYERRSEGGRVLTPAAEQLRRSYDAILIDEYQDTNETQEMIFSAVSQNGSNLFMVGDVKQSIYRFRQAKPELFLEKKEHYQLYDGTNPCFPAKIILSENFRTRRETTELINFIFSLCMTPIVGEMYYRQEDFLSARASYDEQIKIPVTLTVLDCPQSDSDETALEPAYVAREIRTLLASGTPVKEGNTYRPIRPKDICILFRSPKNKAQKYLDALKMEGIACRLEQGGNFLQDPLVSASISFLKVLMNPLLDMELAQVLLSPLYDLSSEDIASVKTCGRTTPLFVLIKKAVSDGNVRFNRFLQDFRLLRHEAMELPAHELLLQLYTKTGILYKAQAVGEKENENLWQLMRYAVEQEENYPGVSGFVAYLTALQEAGIELPAPALSGLDAVSIMSVHKSKGLEFPVVFLVETAAAFNLTDLRNDIQLHPELGFASVRKDSRSMTRRKTIPQIALGIQNRQAQFSEELRILYVALTRAKERLYITASDRAGRLMQKAAIQPLCGEQLSPWSMLSAGSWFEWIAAALCRHSGWKDELSGDPRFVPRKSCADSSDLTVNFLTGITGPVQVPHSGNQPERPDENSAVQLRKEWAYCYPYAADTITPSKLSVSQLVAEQKQEEYWFARRPRALQQQGMTPAERGTALHKFMQFADYFRAAENPQAEILRMKERAFLSSEEAAVVSPEKISEFFNSALGRKILAAPQLYREARFLREFSAEELAGISPAFSQLGGTVVQGVADCVIVENGQGTLVDYKTDRVSEMSTLEKRYAVQLRLYQKALEDHLHLPISSCCIYSFALGQTLEINCTADGKKSSEPY